ncbi:hypothetical protein P22_2567 [Propionispora sp. 2/2-37]|uniref:phosphate signaling complex protein PhoU n=1 Tax=Propionispora sp. 2/2-37 TaxID=1677858 RepID=UPI0006BB64CB|nr:phosphate signaling complex protein PhoU [Propionispora sp. 2/2-37]CUH96477.1 hypothetical protein P22_2567 [Propionispora sp. 2/2-37]
MPSTRQGFNLELEALRQEILAMGNMVMKSIDEAVLSLSTGDSALARKVMTGDDEIDAMEVDIEDKCMILIARQQPLARDLRILGTGLKITTDLERMGDHAYDIANITLKIHHEPLIKPLVDIPRMAQMGKDMLQNSLEAYLTLDVAMAEKVCQADDAVDDLYQQVVRELLTYMMEKPNTISQATQILFVARYLERIADHATNIAEWVIYLATGERLRKK